MVRIDTDEQIVWIELPGILGIKEIEAAVDQLLDHPDHRDGMDEIWDFRHTNFVNIGAEQLRSFAIFVASRLDRLANRVVYVPGRDLEYGIVRMWEAYAEEEAPQERKILHDIDAAREWLLVRR